MTFMRRLDLDEEGLPRGDSVPLGKDLGQVLSLYLAPDFIYFTSSRDKKISNLYRMNLEGGHITQLTNTFADVLCAAPSPDASEFYATLYQHAEEKLYSFDSGKFINSEQTPAPSTYLSNSF